MPPIIALFDIDGTLLSAGGAGRRAVERALGEVLDRAEENVNLRAVEFAGRTDPWIIASALRYYGVAVEDRLIDEVLERYVSHLPRELELANAFEVMPGVTALLGALEARSDVVLGLGTGNTEQAAYAKLARGGLDAFFGFGGFGSDHVNRAELLRAGLRRGLQSAGLEPGGVEVVVIGDTPHDVTAANQIGARCIAVTTGSYGASELEAAGDSVVVEDLRAVEVQTVFRSPS